MSLGLARAGAYFGALNRCIFPSMSEHSRSKRSSGRGLDGDGSARAALTLLHLSDTQFGPRHRFQEGNPLGGLLDRLSEDLEELRRVDGLWPDLAVVTGDLTEYGMPSQFETFGRFAEGLAKLLGLPRRRVVLVPGNHDVNRKLCEGYFNECEGSERAPERPYWPKLQPYADFVTRFYEGEADLRFIAAEPWTLFELADLRVVLDGLASTIPDRQSAPEHYGVLGEQQIRAFAEKLRPYKAQRWLRIAAVHHDPLRAERPPAEQDVKDFKRRLGPIANLVLHGHIHEEQLQWLDTTIPVLAIGSASVQLEERPPEVPNQYQVIRLFSDRFVYGSRAYVPDQKRWIGDNRVDPEGREWLCEKKVAFDAVDAAFASTGSEVLGPGADLVKQVERYRRQLGEELKRESMFDKTLRGEDSDCPGGLELLRLFVPQKVRLQAPQGDLPRALAPDEEDVSAADCMGAVALSSALKGPPQPVQNVLGSPADPWIVLLGAPGAGKSVLTRWLALALCTAGESVGELPMDLVPVRVEMRRFDASYVAATAAGRPYDLLEHAAEQHAERRLDLGRSAMEALGKQGRIVWLFDGLDEVADPDARRRYAEMIAGLKRDLGGRGVVTCRIVGVRPARPALEAANCTIYTLLDFDDAQIDDFLGRWHDAAFPHHPAAGRDRRERLRQRLRDSRALRELAGNPLLLTMLALLNRGGEVAGRRIELYADVLTMMAEQWDARKKLPPTAAARFELKDKLRFMRELAWTMMEELSDGRGNFVREDDLLAFATRFCEESYGEGRAEARRTAALLIEHLRERNYVIALLGGRAFGFVHKSFLEYLAAQEIAHRFRSHVSNLEQLVELFRKRWRNDGWKETLTLACGLVGEDRPEHAVALLQGMLATASVLARGNVWSYAELAVSCLAEIGRIEQEPLRTFALRLTTLMTATASNHVYSPRAKLYAALRLFGAAWPGAAQMHAAMREAPSGLRRRTLANLVIATMAIKDRANALLEILDESTGEGLDNARAPADLIEEAAQIGPWADDEVGRLVLGSRGRRAVHVGILVGLVRTGVVALADELDRELEHGHVGRPELAAEALLAIPRLRATAIQVLEASPNWRSLDILFEAELSRKEADRAGAAARTVLALIIQEASVADGAGLGQLQLVSHPAVGAALAAVADDAMAWSDADAHLVIGDAFLQARDARAARHLRKASAAGNVQAATRLSEIPACREEGLSEMARIARLGTRAWERSSAIRFLHRANSNVMLIDVARNSPFEESRLEAAVALVQDDARPEARTILRDLASGAKADAVRVRAAAALQRAALPRHDWEPVLREVATRAKKPEDRVAAAKALRDEPLLAELAALSGMAGDDARETLARLRAFRSLLRVGRKRKARVLLDGVPVGLLEETSGGSRFTYGADYLTSSGAAPIAPTLPLTESPYESEELHPFFENLLPQGRLLDLTWKKLGLDPADSFGMLLATCADAAGAVELLPIADTA